MTKQRIKPVRWWDFQAAILGLVILQIAAARLVATQWTPHLTLVPTVAFFGIILGLALGQSIFSRILSGIFAIAYGICIIPWQLGLTLGTGIAWTERLESLHGRIGMVFQELIQRQPITDNLLFLLLMALVFWIISVYAGYTLVRYGYAWRVVLPGGVTAFVIHVFDPLLASRSWYLAFYLFFALLLIARLVYLKNRTTWKQHHTHTPPDIGFDLARLVTLVTLVIVLLAWNVPVVAETVQPVASIWRAASHPWMSMRDRLSFAFASLRASVGMVADLYGDSLPLGLGTPLSDQVMMEVEAPGVSPQSARYYWRARVYSHIEDDQWYTGWEDKREFFPGGRDLTQPGMDARAEATFTFFPHKAISILYVPPQPLWISRPADATMVTNPDGTIDLESFRALEYLRPGEQYEVRSSLSAVTIKDLREAGTNYPQWVLERYLQIPDDITQRTYDLAQQLAQGKNTPYDVVATVTEYLRNTISYQLTIDPPPTGVNRIDWFLFEYQKGFCYYYATSEVLLLRSLGIPARIAVGFSQGERVTEIIDVQRTGTGDDQGSGAQMADTVTYVVRQNNAHAWPEVYFPGIGWVEFEPTSGQDPLFRPSGEDYSDNGQDPSDQEQNAGIRDLLSGVEDRAAEDSQTSEDISDSLNFWTPSMILRVGTLVLVVAVLVWVIIKTRQGVWVVSWLERLSQQTSSRVESGLLRLGIKPPAFVRNWVYVTRLPLLGRAYLEINRSLKRQGREGQIFHTPAERAKTLIDILPQAEVATNRLVSEYQTGIYSPYPANEDAAWQASIKIRNQSYLAIIKRFLARFQESERKKPL